MLKQLAIVLILYIFFDSIWFAASVPSVYIPQLTKIQGEIPNFMLKMHGGLFAWFLLALGMVVFVLPKVNSATEAAFYGFLYGLIVYGIYNGTNYVVFNKYDYKIFLPDLIWGTFASTLIASIMFKFKN